ncbi:MAG: molecular chaperone [Geminicoccaceae bacterium]
MNALAEIERRGFRSESTEEDGFRAVVYRLLARLLAAPPDEQVLQALGTIEADGTPLGEAYGALGREAGQTDPSSIEREYHDLFIGVGRGELVPFGSYYLTGFLNEKPLALLRADMKRIGIARADHAREPEDHIAALCEMMAGLIEGDYGEPAHLSAQHRFFESHIGAWAALFFRDLQAAKRARFYAAVGLLGERFVDIEATAFTFEAGS